MEITKTSWVALKYKKDDKVYICFAKRSKKANNPKLWNLFGGGLEIKETPIQTAYRELKEEAGITNIKLELVKSLKVKNNEINLFTNIGYFTELPKIKINKESSEYKWLALKGFLKLYTKKVLHQKTKLLNRYILKLLLGDE